MRRSRFALLMLVGLSILLAVMFYVGFWSVVEQFFTLGWRWFVVFLGLQLILMFLWALKWSIVLKNYGIPFKRILPISFVGYFMNNITPMGLAGGEPMRAYMLGKLEDISIEDSAASVIVDLFLEILPLLFMIFLAIYYVISFGVDTIVFILLSAAAFFIFLVMVFILLLVANERLSNILVSRFVRMVSKIPISFLRDHALEAEHRIESIIKNFKDALKTTMSDFNVIFFGTIISTLVWFVNISRIYLIFKMLEVDLTVPVLVVTRVTVLSASFMSIIPGAVGLWEGVTTFVFSLFAISASTAMAAALVERLFSYVIANIIGFVSAAYLGYTKIVSKIID